MEQEDYMTDCKYLRPNKVCTKLSDREVSQPCVESPCEYEKPMTDTEKDIAALDIGIQAIERNQAAIDECKKQIDCLEDEIVLDQAKGFFVDWLESKVDAYECILKILEGEEC